MTSTSKILDSETAVNFRVCLAESKETGLLNVLADLTLTRVSLSGKAGIPHRLIGIPAVLPQTQFTMSGDLMSQQVTGNYSFE